MRLDRQIAHGLDHVAHLLRLVEQPGGSRISWTDAWIRRRPSIASAADCPVLLISAARRATSSTDAARLAATEEVCSSSRVVALVSRLPPPGAPASRSARWA